MLMDSDQDVELLCKAIQKLLQEKRNREAAGEAYVEDDDNHFLLSNLLSQLKLAKGNIDPNAPCEELAEKVAQTEAGTTCSLIYLDKAGAKTENSVPSENHTKETTTEEMVKEIKDLKRQNRVTHLLLSGLILLTVAWQLGEVSVILKFKDRLSHPFRSFGNAFMGMLKGQGSPNNEVREKHRLSSKENRHIQVESHSAPSFHVPDLLRDLGFNDEE